MHNDTTGLDLKIERVRARITAKRLADELGVTRQRVSAIEALAFVNSEQVDRYRSALVSLTSDAEKPVTEARSAA